MILSLTSAPQVKCGFDLCMRLEAKKRPLERLCRGGSPTAAVGNVLPRWLTSSRRSIVDASHYIGFVNAPLPDPAAHIKRLLPGKSE